MRYSQYIIKILCMVYAHVMFAGRSHCSESSMQTALILARRMHAHNNKDDEIFYLMGSIGENEIFP